ncbi:MAG: Ig-like domain-containing protein, partial [Bacteroidia bacterium]
MKTISKIFIIGLCLLFSVAAGFAQGLDSVIVERFYKSNAADAAGSVGVLPAGSWTYRIYVDLAPGYEFQAAYGVDVLPIGLSVGDHELRLQTSTSFFNNEDRCGTTANSIGQGFMDDNTVMLDSWVSVGAASTTKMGVLKSEDDGIATVVNSNGILQNNDPLAGIPLTVQDGFYSGVFAPEPVNPVGITSDLSVFDCTSQAGNLFSTSNGSWASLNGSSGPLASNRVLIAQITTDGIFSYKLNLQLGLAAGGGTINWVAENPVGAELTHPSLMGTIAPPVPNVPPTVSIINPTNGANFLTGATVTIDANANDSDGSIDSVQFFVGALYIGSDLAGPNPYTINWIATVGTHNLTAKAWDNNGASTTSAVITINVGNNPPPVVAITSPSNGALFTAPAVVNISANASDPNGTVDSVQFFVNAVYVGSDITPPTPFTFAWTSVIGPASLTA